MSPVLHRRCHRRRILRECAGRDAIGNSGSLPLQSDGGSNRTLPRHNQFIFSRTAGRIFWAVRGSDWPRSNRCLPYAAPRARASRAQRPWTSSRGHLDFTTSIDCRARSGTIQPVVGSRRCRGPDALISSLSPARRTAGGGAVLALCTGPAAHCCSRLSSSCVRATLPATQPPRCRTVRIATHTSAIWMIDGGARTYPRCFCRPLPSLPLKQTLEAHEICVETRNRNSSAYSHGSPHEPLCLNLLQRLNLHSLIDIDDDKTERRRRADVASGVSSTTS